MDRPAVLLLNPRVVTPANARMPLSLLHLAAVLEGRHPWRILDGNVERDLVGLAVRAVRERPHALVGLTVMPGPQVAPAIELSRALRAAAPEVPLVWGGYFPTLYPDAAAGAPYVSAAVRGQGEGTLLRLLEGDARDASFLRTVPGLSFRDGEEVVHNPEAPLLEPASLPPLPYEGLAGMERYLARTYLGRRTALHQAAVGCRWRCTFCGVVSMWNGRTLLDTPTRVYEAGRALRDRWGADAWQLVDHNFFDSEENALPVLGAMERLALPWWCYARADTMAGFSTRTWEQLRRSALKMVYVGAESVSDATLRSMHKGSRVEHTLELVRRCKAYGVVPELSFILGGPEEGEEALEPTFEFLRRVKALHPEAEVILYFYSPTPQRAKGAPRDGRALPVLGSYGPGGPALPSTPEEWAEPRWVRWVCHQDAPWLSERQRQRVRDFSRVLACRFPTVTEVRAPAWHGRVLEALARWRWATRSYGRPWELALAQRALRQRVPAEEGL